MARTWRWTELLIVVWIFGCAAPKMSVNEGEYPSGMHHYHIELDAQGRKQGLETWWYENGVKKFETQNDRGEQNGPFRAWYPNGKIWYRGFEDHGLTQDTLTYWYSNGRLQTRVLFDEGRQMHRWDFDSTGSLIEPAESDTAALRAKRDSIARVQRDLGMQKWSERVRATVEQYWVLPKALVKQDNRATAKIRVNRTGRILSVVWIEKSRSGAFNELARKALLKVRRFPEFPPSVTDADLEIQYDFVAPGASTETRRALQLHGEPKP